MSLLRHFRLSWFVVLLTFTLLTLGCGGNKRVNKDNFSKIKESMSKAEVEAILGPGEADTGVGLTEGSSVAGAVGIGDMSTVSRPSGPVWMKWGDDNKYIKVRFVGDRVEKGQIQQKGL